MKEPAPIAVEVDISPKEFRRRYVRMSKPVLLRGAALTWRCVHRWSSDYLLDVLGEKPVVVEFNEHSVFDFNENAKTGRVELLHVTFAEAWRLINVDRNIGCGAHYLRELPVYDHFLEILEDLEYPAWISLFNENYPPRIWMGSMGTISPLHHDGGEENLLVQIKGTKECILFSPFDASLLYPNHNGHLKHLSMVNYFAPEHSHFPKFSDATPFRAVLRPGDMLYIPRHWWHTVRSLEVAISVNYWWRSLWHALLARVHLRDG